VATGAAQVVGFRIASAAEKEEVGHTRRAVGLLSSQLQTSPETLSIATRTGAPESPKVASTAPDPVEELLAYAEGESEVFASSKVVRKAFRVAAKAHEGQYRRSGEIVLAHCVETGLILARCGLDEHVVAAGILHDTLDDTEATKEDLASHFPKAVVDLVSSVSEMSNVSQLHRDSVGELDSSMLKSLRTMLLAMTDARVVIIKLADRLHNMRTLSVMPSHKQQTMSRETLDVFVPLANRLGIWGLKAELEDLCFRYLLPEDFSQLQEAVASTSNPQELERCVTSCKSALDGAGVRSVDITGRPKSLYGIHQKMESKKLAFEEVHDVRALRVIVESEEECYQALETLHALWTPVEGRLKDYIHKPKANAYRSLHTVVTDEMGCSFEVQIRTVEMHQVAEYGLAAHWRYKEREEQGGQAANSYVEEQIAWARYMLSFQAELSDMMKVHADCDTSAKDRLVAPCPPAAPAVSATERCKFPEHATHCPVSHFGGVGRMPVCCQAVPAAAAADRCADRSCGHPPVYVVTLSGDAATFAVEELAAHSTVADLLKRTHPSSSATELLASGLRILVNHEPVAAFGPAGAGEGEGEEECLTLDTVLHMGDRIELLYDADPALTVDLSPAAVDDFRHRLSRMAFARDLAKAAAASPMAPKVGTGARPRAVADAEWEAATADARDWDDSLEIRSHKGVRTLKLGKPTAPARRRSARAHSASTAQTPEKLAM